MVEQKHPHRDDDHPRHAGRDHHHGDHGGVGHFHRGGQGHVRAPASFGKAFAISLDTARVVGEGGLRLLWQFERTCAGDQWARGGEQADHRWLAENGGGGQAGCGPSGILFWRLMAPKS